MVRRQQQGSSEGRGSKAAAGSARMHRQQQCKEMSKLLAAKGGHLQQCKEMSKL